MTDTTDVDTCLPVDAQLLGFHIYHIDAAPPKEELDALEATIKYKSLVNLDILVEKMGRRAVDPATPLRTQKEIAEMMGKLGGMDDKKRDYDGQTAGPGYQLVINIGNAAPATFSGVTVEQSATLVENTPA